MSLNDRLTAKIGNILSLGLDVRDGRVVTSRLIEPTGSKCYGNLRSDAHCKSYNFGKTCTLSESSIVILQTELGSYLFSHSLADLNACANFKYVKDQHSVLSLDADSELHTDQVATFSESG